MRNLTLIALLLTLLAVLALAFPAPALAQVTWETDLPDPDANAYDSIGVWQRADIEADRKAAEAIDRLAAAIETQNTILSVMVEQQSRLRLDIQNGVNAGLGNVIAQAATIRQAINQVQAALASLGDKVAAAAEKLTPPEPATPAPSPLPTPTGRVNANTATALELAAIPGIKANVAVGIVTLRDQLGGFTDIEQIDDVYGVGPATMAIVREWLTLTEPVDPLDLFEE